MKSDGTSPEVPFFYAIIFAKEIKLFAPIFASTGSEFIASLETAREIRDIM